MWPLVLAGAAIGVILLPWALQYLHLLEFNRLVPGRAPLPEETPLRGATTFTWAAIPYTLFVDAIGDTLGPSLRALHEMPPSEAIRPHLVTIAATGLVFGAVALAGAWSLRGRRFTLALLLSVFLLPLLVVSYFAIMNFKTFNARYASSGLPAWFALLAAGFVALPGRLRIVAASCALLLCVA